MGEVAVKICGLQSVEVLKSMVNLPVDYVGFVFARSKRQVSGGRAAELLPVLQEWSAGGHPQSVGVFVDPTLEELDEVLRQAPLDILQLHGTESPDFCRKVKDVFWGQDFQGVFGQNGRIGPCRGSFGGVRRRAGRAAARYVRPEVRRRLRHRL
ncbi:hypothetical protein HMSSN139_26070 [Paenibacillus sp. HMSSN-139]|nr:hypothetical protein HMSSN139_26070 [Paenibacillus sp. HMSSN-139]